MRSTPQLRRAYQIAVRDARAHGERSVSYYVYRQLVALQLRMAATDPGGNIRL